MKDHERLLLKLRAELTRVADPRKASAMQRYMKSAIPYYGVPAPLLRSVFKTVFAEFDFADAGSWKTAVLHVWRNARFREEMYAAIELSQSKKASAFQTASTLSMYEEMIVAGAWWDFVDSLASRSVGELLRRYPGQVGRKMRSWNRSPNIWKRRTSILCQLKFKRDTDLQMLYDCIEPSLDSKEFFLQKAIGWALRQHAWTDPQEVQRYIRAHEGRLSALSKREALRNIRKR